MKQNTELQRAPAHGGQRSANDPQGGRRIRAITRLARRGFLEPSHVAAAADLQRRAEQLVRCRARGQQMLVTFANENGDEGLSLNQWSDWLKAWGDGVVRWHRREKGRRVCFAYPREQCLAAALDAVLHQETVRQLESRYGFRAGHGQIIIKLVLTHYAEALGLSPAGRLSPWLRGGHAQ